MHAALIVVAAIFCVGFVILTLGLLAFAAWYVRRHHVMVEKTIELFAHQVKNTSSQYSVISEQQIVILQRVASVEQTLALRGDIPGEGPSIWSQAPPAAEVDHSELATSAWRRLIETM